MYTTLDIHNNDLFSFIDNVPDAMVITNNEGKIVLINPQTEKIFGYSQEELLGEPVELLLPERFRESHKKHLENYSNKPAIRPMGTGINIVGKRKDGSEVPLDIGLSPWRNGDEVLVISFIRDITERKRTENRLRKNKELEILNTFTQAVHKSLDLEEVYNVALDMASELENVDMTFIYLVDGDRKEAVLQAHRNLSEDYIRRAQRIPYPKGATWQVINTGKILNIENVQKDPNIEQAGRNLGHHSALGIPITTEGEATGVLWFFSYKERRFEEEQVALLTSIGNQIAMAIAKAGLYRDLARKSKYEAIIRTVTQNVHSSLDLQEVLENAVQSMCEDIEGVDKVAIYMVEGEEAVLKAHRGLTDSFIERAGRIPYPKGVTWKTIIEGKPRYCADTDKDEYIGPAGRKEGIKSYLSMPIGYEDKTIGCININSKQKDVLEESKLLEVVSHQISIAIKNAQQAEALLFTQFSVDRFGDAAFWITPDARFLYVNDAACNLLGYSHEELLSMSLQDIDPNFSEEAWPDTWEKIKQCGTLTFEAQTRGKDGNISPVEVTANYLNYRGKEYHCAFVRNITERKRMEEELVKTQKLESVGILAGGIAHDLNNMLTPIIVSLQLLRNKFKDDKSLRWIDTIEASARRGAGLIQQILVFSKGAGGDKVLLQASYLLSETNKILQDTLSKSIEVDIGIPKGLWNIMGEPTQLQQVLMNLCVNARDAMPAGGRLKVSAENLYIDPNYAQIHIDAQPGPYVVITVSDTGTGIAPEIIDRMFEPFFTTKDPGQGTGLGLSTAYRIIKDHEGFITVRSERGVGTEFKLYLPAIETTETTQAIRDYETDTPLGNGELVLVVDDEAAVRDITKLTLEAFGYRAITADDGAEAVGVYAQNKDDIKAIILDMMMPIMDGSATIRALKKVDPDVKIIAVSGLIDTKAILTSDNLTVDAFLNKPYTAGTLLKTLYEVLRFTNKPPNIF